jgi:hypothetical protein
LADSAGGLSGANGASGDTSGAIPPTSGDSSDNQSTSVHPPNTPSAAPADEDPEYEFFGKRAKRSVHEKRFKDFEKGFYSKAQQAAETQKKYTALEQALSRTGISVKDFLENPDAHFDKAAQDRIARQMDEAMMDPRERELTQKEREFAEREARVKEWEEKQAKEASERSAAERAEKIAESMAPALMASGLPANPKTVARMAEVMAHAYRNGVRLEPSEATDYVREQLSQEQSWHLNQYADPESFVKAIGPERLEMVRQYLLAQAKRPNNPAQKPRVATTAARDEQTGRYIGWGDYAKTRRI